MGTTVTTHLGLIKPDINESIEENLPTFPGWASQNASNMNAIDALFRTSTHTWSPTWTADAGNPTLGSGGFVEGKYIRLFPRMVIGYVRLYMGGSGFATGTGLYRISPPPVAIAPELIGLAGQVALGKAYIHDDSGVASSTVMGVMYDTANNVLFFRKHSGDAWRSTTPFTPAQQDRMSCYFMYPTTAA